MGTACDDGARCGCGDGFLAKGTFAVGAFADEALANGAAVGVAAANAGANGFLKCTDVCDKFRFKYFNIHTYYFITSWCPHIRPHT